MKVTVAGNAKDIAENTTVAQLIVDEKEIVRGRIGEETKSMEIFRSLSRTTI